MSIERIEFRGDDGIRYVARVTAVALVANVDEMTAESYITVAGRCILVRTPLEEVREALFSDLPDADYGLLAAGPGIGYTV